MSVVGYCYSGVSDQQLEESLKALVKRERGVTAELLAHLAEVDSRRLCGARTEGTLFNYCVRVLGFTEDEAGKRIRAARAARKFPVIYDHVASGELGQTAVSRLAPHLTEENHRELLAAASRKTIRELEEVLAAWFPKPDVPTSIRKLPARAPAVVVDAGAANAETTNARVTTTAQPPVSGTDARLAGGDERQPTDGQERKLGSDPHVVSAPRPFAKERGDRGSVAPLSPGRYLLKATLSAAVYEKVLRAQALMGHAQPDGDLSVVLDRALTLLIDDIERRKFGKCKRPRAQADESGRGRDGDATVARAETVQEREPVEAPAVTAGVATGSTVPTPEPSASPGQSVRSASDRPVTSRCSDGAASEVVSKPVAGNSAPPRSRPRNGGRAVRRAVTERDGARCSFVGPDGRRCEERRSLELHHCESHAYGGEPTAENLTWRCRAHHRHQTVLDFGEKASPRGRPRS